jgi:hypothetical protein
MSPQDLLNRIHDLQDEPGLRLVLKWKTVALSHMPEFIDIDTKDNGNGKRRRK